MFKPFGIKVSNFFFCFSLDPFKPSSYDCPETPHHWFKSLIKFLLWSQLKIETICVNFLTALIRRRATLSCNKWSSSFAKDTGRTIWRKRGYLVVSWGWMSKLLLRRLIDRINRCNVLTTLLILESLPVLNSLIKIISWIDVIIHLQLKWQIGGRWS